MSHSLYFWLLLARHFLPPALFNNNNIINPLWNDTFFEEHFTPQYLMRPRLNKNTGGLHYIKTKGFHRDLKISRLAFYSIKTKGFHWDFRIFREAIHSIKTKGFHRDFRILPGPFHSTTMRPRINKNRRITLHQNQRISQGFENFFSGFLLHNNASKDR